MSEYSKLGQITGSQNDFKFNDKKNGVVENQPTIVEGYKYKQPQSGSRCEFHQDCKGFRPDTGIECVKGKCIKQNFTGCI